MISFLVLIITIGISLPYFKKRNYSVSFLNFCFSFRVLVISYRCTVLSYFVPSKTRSTYICTRCNRAIWAFGGWFVYCMTHGRFSACFHLKFAIYFLIKAEIIDNLYGNPTSHVKTFSSSSKNHHSIAPLLSKIVWRSSVSYSTKICIFLFFFVWRAVISLSEILQKLYIWNYISWSFWEFFFFMNIDKSYWAESSFQ